MANIKLLKKIILRSIKRISMNKQIMNNIIEHNINKTTKCKIIKDH